MQIDIIKFNESLTEFGFKPSEINAINLRIHTHIIPQLEAIQVQAKVMPKLADIEDIFNNEEHRIELDNSKLLREVENLINKSVIYSKGKMLEDIRSKFSV